MLKAQTQELSNLAEICRVQEAAKLQWTDISRPHPFQCAVRGTVCGALCIPRKLQQQMQGLPGPWQFRRTFWLSKRAFNVNVANVASGLLH